MMRLPPKALPYVEQGRAADIEDFAVPSRLRLAARAVQLYIKDVSGRQTVVEKGHPNKTLSIG